MGISRFVPRVSSLLGCLGFDSLPYSIPKGRASCSRHPALQVTTSAVRLWLFGMDRTI